MDERTTEILTEARAIISAIEERSIPLSRVALRARRLAQLIDDDMNYVWLQLECEGATGGAPPERKCMDAEAATRGGEKFVTLRAAVNPAAIGPEDLVRAIYQGKILERTRVMARPLAILEREGGGLSREQEVAVADKPGGTHALAALRMIEHDRRTAVERVAGAIHGWATNIYIVHKFRQIAGNIFDRFKTKADTTLSVLCPEALHKLTHAIERASSDKPEDWSAAALACRRVLKDFADAVYPPRDEKVDGRDVTADKFKNRLWAFAKERGKKAVESQFLDLAEIDGLCGALDRLNDLDAKGVHDNVDRHDAEMMVLRTYILLVQLAQLVGHH